MPCRAAVVTGVEDRSKLVAELGEVRSWQELSDSGLLWLINRVVFHPRGFTLVLHKKQGELVGWRLLGDGSEPWHFESDEDARFAAAEDTLRAYRAPQ